MKKKINIILALMILSSIVLSAFSYQPVEENSQQFGSFPGAIGHGDDFIDPEVMELIEGLKETSPCVGNPLTSVYSFTCLFPKGAGLAKATVPYVRTWNPLPLNGIVRVPVNVPVDYDVQNDFSFPTSQSGTVEYTYDHVNDYNVLVKDRIRLYGYHVDIILSSVRLQLDNGNLDSSDLDQKYPTCDSSSLEVMSNESASFLDLVGIGGTKYASFYKFETNRYGYEDEQISVNGEVVDLYKTPKLSQSGMKGNTMEQTIVTAENVGSFLLNPDVRTSDNIWKYFTNTFPIMAYQVSNPPPYPSEVNMFEDAGQNTSGDSSSNTSGKNGNSSGGGGESYEDISSTSGGDSDGGGALHPFISYAAEEGLMSDKQQVTAVYGDQYSTSKTDTIVLLNGACPTYFTFVPNLSSAHSEQETTFNGFESFEFRFGTKWYVYVRAEWTGVEFYNENYETCQIYQNLNWYQDHYHWTVRRDLFEKKLTKYHRDLRAWEAESGNLTDPSEIAAHELIKPSKPTNNVGLEPILQEYLDLCGDPWEPKTTPLYDGDDLYMSGSWLETTLEGTVPNFKDARSNADQSFVDTFKYPVFEAQSLFAPK